MDSLISPRRHAQNPASPCSAAHVLGILPRFRRHRAAGLAFYASRIIPSLQASPASQGSLRVRIAAKALDTPEASACSREKKCGRWFWCCSSCLCGQRRCCWLSLVVRPPQSRGGSVRCAASGGTVPRAGSAGSARRSFGLPILLCRRSSPLCGAAASRCSPAAWASSRGGGGAAAPAARRSFPQPFSVMPCPPGWSVRVAAQPLWSGIGERAASRAFARPSAPRKKYFSTRRSLTSNAEKGTSRA
jgi:hypothetical protein